MTVTFGIGVSSALRGYYRFGIVGQGDLPVGDAHEQQARPNEISKNLQILAKGI